MTFNLAIFGLGTLMFIIWIIGSIVEFYKMKTTPKKYIKRHKIRLWIDRNHPMPEPSNG